MRITFLNPPIPKETIVRIGPVTANLFYNSPPLGLCYLAAFMRRDGHEVGIIDAALENMSDEAITKRIGLFDPDIVGITVFAVSQSSTRRLLAKLRSSFPGIVFVVGGPHLSADPKYLLDFPVADAAVIGEGEITFLEAIRSIEAKSPLEMVRGLALRHGDGIFFTGKRDLIENMDMLPYPARDLVPILAYKPQPNDQRRLPKISMITSRGCPYSCVFCDKNVFGARYRSFSAGYIVEEMGHLARDFGAKDIAFVDSTFTPTRQRVYDIIREIRKSRLDLAWTCSVRADVLDKELLAEMKNAGCWRVRIGIESGNEDILKFIKKGITRSQVRQVAEWAHDLDLEPKGFFMIGHLPETKESIEETIEFALSLPLKDITVQINTPLPNTEQYALAEEYGQMISSELSRYSFWEPIFLPKGISRREMLAYYGKFYSRFYLRPVIWHRHLRGIRSFSDVIKYLRGIRLMVFFFILWVREKL